MTWPIYYRWTGDVMEPLPRFKHRCDEDFVVGQIYRLVHEEERSSASNAHYHASLKAAWSNLREEFAGRFPSVQHFRKWLLIKSGYCKYVEYVYDTPADAVRAGGCIRQKDPYCVIVIRGCVVTEYTALSQSPRSSEPMDKKIFHASKEATLALAATMTGNTVEELTDNPDHDETETREQVT